MHYYIEWSINWLALIKLSRKVLVIPANIAICKKVLKTKPYQELFAFKFEGGDIGCFDAHFIYKHYNCKHQLECSSYSLEERDRI